MAISSDAHTIAFGLTPLFNISITPVYPVSTFKLWKYVNSSLNSILLSCNAFLYPVNLFFQALLSSLLTPIKAISLMSLSIKYLVTSYVAFTLSIVTLGKSAFLSSVSTNTVFTSNSFIKSNISFSNEELI